MELFERLAVVLQRSGLGWIVTQVTEQIQVGKTVFKEVETLKRSGQADIFGTSVGRIPGGLKTGPKAQFPATIEYDDKEKLVLLMDGISQATNTIEMQNEFLKAMNVLGGPAEAAFYSEETGTTGRVITSNEVAAKAPLVSGFRDFLSKLREEAEKD